MRREGEEGSQVQVLKSKGTGFRDSQSSAKGDHVSSCPGIARCIRTKMEMELEYSEAVSSLLASIWFCRVALQWKELESHTGGSKLLAELRLCCTLSDLVKNPGTVWSNKQS